MRTLLLLAVAVATFGCAAAPSAHGGHFRQAAAPMPAPVRPPPVYTPGYSPGTPPAPVHTPAGAGLPGERVPGQVQGVPRSPNKRTLPPTKEPGLWAADGAPRASARSFYLFDIPLSYPPSAKTHGDRQATDQCVQELNNAADEVKAREVVANLNLDTRGCVAARAYLHCAVVMLNFLEGLVKRGDLREPALVGRYRDMVAHATHLEKALCDGSEMSQWHNDLLRSIKTKWERNLVEEGQ